MRIRSAVIHAAQALTEGALLALIVVTLVAGTALAAKGGGGKPGSGGTGTINLVVMDGGAVAHYGDKVTFTVSTTATQSPYVHLKCYQGGALVLESWQGFFPTALGNQWFYLGPSLAWTGGAAECTAYLEKTARKGAWSILGSTSFHVDP